MFKTGGRKEKKRKERKKKRKRKKRKGKKTVIRTLVFAQKV